MAGGQVYKIEFRANPTQRAFIHSRAEADLFDCRKGEGKSAALAWCVFNHTMENPGAEWLVIRDTWENCRRTTQREFFKWFPPGVIGEYKAGDKEFSWKGERVGLRGRVTFIGLDDPEDASKVASMPLAGFAMDEPSPASAESEGISELIFETAIAQLRQEGMRWYGAKLAQNNPDERHWTYRRFWDPGTPGMRPEGLMPEMQVCGFRAWQTVEPENEAHLPRGYYAGLKVLWRDRPDLLRRFVEGRHGFQQAGMAVTPEWTDELHLGRRLGPVKGVDLVLCWDFGLTPVCLVTQVTPLGHWNVLWSLCGERCGTEELIMDHVKALIAQEFRGFTWRHIGDPAGLTPDPSAMRNSPVRVIRRELGGRWTSGPQSPIAARVEPLRAILRRVVSGRAMLQVDRERSKEVWHALRGGWHYNVARSGVVGEIAKTHPASDAGDAIGYAAAVLFPLGKLVQPGVAATRSKVPQPGWFGREEPSRQEFARPWIKRVPMDGERM